MKFFPTPSDEKMTPHLLKKKYWEDKARDLRDENDNLCAVNESLVRTRIPSAGIWDQDHNLNPKNKRILRYVFYRYIFHFLSYFILFFMIIFYLTAWQFHF